MTDGSSKVSRLRIPVLILFIIAVLLFLGMVFTFFTRPPEAPAPTSTLVYVTITPLPSSTPTATNTITPTPRPTWTLRPSMTASQTPLPTDTPTATLIKTITPAKPSNYNTFYELKPWGLADQSYTIQQLQANTILSPSDAAYQALAYAESEGNLRFPDALEAEEWRWDRAYNFLYIGDPLGIAFYGELIQSALRSGQVRFSDLPTWFSTYEPRLNLQVSSLTPQPGELGRGVIELVGAGSAYLWAVENPGGVTISPLINDIDYKQPHANAFIYGDVSGDSQPDLVVYRKLTPGSTQLSPPHIFDLTSSSPAELDIVEQAPIDFGLEPQETAQVITDTLNGNTLIMTNTLMPSCPTYATQAYHWKDGQFSVSPLEYKLEPVYELRAYCQAVLDSASATWGPDASIIVAESMLDIWPPDTNTQGQPYPADALDELRYRLGVLYALADRPPDAEQMMNEIISTPASPDSDWVVPAQQFLQGYKKPDDLLTTCQQAQFCNMHDALNTMVDYSASTDPYQAMQYLQTHGLATRSSGWLDFDADGQAERWMIIQPKPNAKLEYWILSKTKTGVQPVFVKTIEPSDSLPFFHEPAGTVPVLQFQLHEGFTFNRLPDTLESYIEWVDVEYARPTVIKDGYKQAVTYLMSGTDPNIVLDTMMALYNSPRFKGDCIAFNICDQFHYTLALIYDLLGQQGNAIDQYLWVWRNYGKSPYATMARLKLNYFPLPTYTRTPVPSYTTIPTRTSTPTRTNTPTPTKTNTPTPTASNTPAATPYP